MRLSQSGRRVAAAAFAVLMSGCRAGTTTADRSARADGAAQPRSRGCDELPTAATLKQLLQNAPAQNGDAGGLNHGKAMWGALVNRNGEICALAVSTEDTAATWPGSRGIAMAKAFTANAFSSDV